jgi:hypothetical protein
MSKDLTVWNKRWTSLKTTLGNLIVYYQSLPDADFPRKLTLYRLVERLQEFAETQFTIFYDGFGEHRHFILDPSDEYPPEYALKVTLEQITYDLEVIHRAAAQRISGTDDMKRALKTADELTWKALLPAKNTNLVEPGTTVITYFQKSPSIRLIPYAPIALVGIPLSTIATGRDYLAIPHEVGHYVFRHGKSDVVSLSTDLLNKLPKEPAWCYKWAEEIFADIYGCRIGGPVIALDFQDLQLENSRQDFNKDDGEHPIPALRPDIYHKALQKMGLPNWSTKLDKRWQRELAKRRTPPKFTPPDSAPTDLGACSAVEVVIDEVTARLSGAQIDPWSDSADIASPNVANPQHEDDADFEKLYRDFEENRIPNLVTDVNVDELDEEMPSSVPRPWTDLIRAKLRDPESPRYVLSAEVWVSILNADGWTIRGPQGRN